MLHKIYSQQVIWQNIWHTYLNIYNINITMCMFDNKMKKKLYTTRTVCMMNYQEKIFYGNPWYPDINMRFSDLNSCFNDLANLILKKS